MKAIILNDLDRLSLEAILWIQIDALRSYFTSQILTLY